MLARDVHASGAEAIAVSTLFSFANPENERAIGRVLEELGLPLSLSLSHLILPEFREYERASTVVVNAYLQPVMQSYLQRLDARAAPATCAKAKASRVFVMQSSGGITSLESAARQPVRTVLSGPAGGVVGAAAMARLSGFDRVITFDMGGTSTDVALVDGEAQAQQRGRDCRLAGARPDARHSHRRRRRRLAGALRRRRRACASGRSRRAPIPVPSAMGAARSRR